MTWLMMIVPQSRRYLKRRSAAKSIAPKTCKSVTITKCSSATYSSCRRATGSPVCRPAPTLPDLADRPIAEQAVVSDLQAVATNPYYIDFMQTIEQYWPDLRTVTLQTITTSNTKRDHAERPICCNGASRQSTH